MQLNNIITPFTKLPLHQQHSLIEDIRLSRLTPKQTSKKSKQVVKQKVTKAEKVQKDIDALLVDLSADGIERLLKSL